MTDTKREAPASPEKRAAALEIVLRRKADMPKNFVAEFTEHADDAWITANGAQMVARAWTDPEYRARMLVDGTAAARELGFSSPIPRIGVETFSLVVDGLPISAFSGTVSEALTPRGGSYPQLYLRFRN